MFSMLFGRKKILCIPFHIQANRYLHHMIRYIVGSMIGVYEKRMSKKDFIFIN